MNTSTMDALLPFFLIVFTGVFFSMLLRRAHVPWVVAMIAGGVILGPHVLDVLEISPVVDFIGQIGLVFLMFMAGLETKLSSFKEFRVKLLGLAFLNGAIPFAVGLAITRILGYGWNSSFLVGIIFVSSSIAVVIPSLEKYGFLHTRLGQSVVVTSVIQDIASLVMLSVFLQRLSPVTALPLYVFYPLLLIVIVSLRLLLPRLNRLIRSALTGTKDLFQQEFRSIFLSLLGTVILFEFLGLHAIIAGFFAGFALSDIIESEIMKEKIRTISYGIFIPTFFVLIGVQTDVSILWKSTGIGILIAAVVFGSVLSKFLSGWIGGRYAGFSRDESLLFAVTSIPQLSTTLAVAFTARSLGLIDDRIITAMVFLSVITVVVSPTLMNILSDRIAATMPVKEPLKGPTHHI